MSWTIQSGYGWTDWNAACEVISQSAKAIGVEIIPEMPEGNEFMANRQTGDFQISLTIPGEGIRPSQPWYRYQWVMSDKNVPPVGEMAFTNQMRYSNPRATEIVDLIPTITDEAQLKVLHTELNTIFLQELPLLPIMYPLDKKLNGHAALLILNMQSLKENTLSSCLEDRCSG